EREGDAVRSSPERVRAMLEEAGAEETDHAEEEGRPHADRDDVGEDAQEGEAAHRERHEHVERRVGLRKPQKERVENGAGEKGKEAENEHARWARGASDTTGIPWPATQARPAIRVLGECRRPSKAPQKKR